MTETADVAPEKSLSPAPSGEAHLRLTQIAVLTATVVCGLAFWWAGEFLRVPARPPFEVSLFQQPGAGKGVAVVAAVVLSIGGAAVGHLLAGRWWGYAGPFAAAVGLATWSCRGGPSRYVYFHADSAGTGRGIFFLLAVEQLALAAAAGAAWMFVLRRADKRRAPRANPPGRGIAGKVQAVATQAVATACVVLILCQTDTKKCALASVFVAAFVATALTEHWFKDEHALRWYWAGPLAAGVLGYLLNAFTADPAGIATGRLTGLFAALARPLPLDYASLGAAGALVGHWFGAEQSEEPVGGTPPGLPNPLSP